MNSKGYKVVLSLVLVFMVAASGCFGRVSDPTMPEQPGSTTEVTAEGTTEAATEEPSSAGGIETETVLGDDGSISVTSTDPAGNVVARINYSAASNTTEKYVYEYDEQGRLLRERSYTADGNVVEEFSVGNYEHAHSFGEINYDVPGEVTVDLDHAFSVTLEELAPLYHKAQTLRDTYGVAVLIADKVSDHTDGAEPCFEYEKIQTSLELVESCLACYPADFFRDFSGVVCIQLVGTGSTAGVYMGGNEQLLIQMDTNCYAPDEQFDDEGSFFCYTLHHEIFHMINDMLAQRAAWSQCPLSEERWNSYNPAGFEYVNGYDDEKEAEIYSSGNNYTYFLSSYGCSTAHEDRAMIFGEAMAYYQGYEYMEFTDQVNAKLRYLSDCIKAAFDSDHWEDVAPWDHMSSR